MTNLFQYLPVLLRAAQCEPRIKDLFLRLLDLKPAAKELVSIYDQAEVLINEIMPGLIPEENYKLEWVQASLNLLGEHLVVDGDYGEFTKNAIKRFQNAHGLFVDGWIGPITLISLIKVMDEKNNSRTSS